MKEENKEIALMAAHVYTQEQVSVCRNETKTKPEFEEKTPKDDRKRE